MNRDDLLKQLISRKHNPDEDQETNHMLADRALLEFINDKKITEAFNEIPKWYS